ncbi:MAG TPA: CHAD domain-containing protein [Longimicrobium sp.]|nr:CHAD domain-containing protein [Longimicrobium sp.]
MRTPAELLDLAPERGARWLALRFLDEAAAAHARMEDAADARALHDFRVGLRRLRSALKAYAEYLGGSVTKKDRRRVRDLARATGESRDAEVHIEWLQKRLDALDEREQVGARWLLARLAGDRAKADRALGREVRKDFPRERWRLARRLRFFEVRVDLDDPAGGPRLATVLGRLARDAAAEVEAHLDRVRSIDDQEEAHEARIAAKALRYLVEPFQAEVEGGPETIKRLKKLQDLLGEMHDAEVMLAVVADALEELEEEEKERGDRASEMDAELRRHEDARAESESSADASSDGAAEDDLADDDPRPGLLRLRELLEREKAERFAVLDERWLEGRGDGFFARVREVARDLAATGQAPREIERKFLLKRMPRLEGEAEVWEIDQGWLPGEKLAERLRRVRRPDGSVSYFRTVKLGAGASRFELEEETTPEVFRRLWSLTRGKRVRKTRYRIEDGPFTWEIDRFRGRRLVLAEVELPDEDTAVTPPAWLARHVVRDVTDEPDYVNINLAR